MAAVRLLLLWPFLLLLLLLSPLLSSSEDVPTSEALALLTLKNTFTNHDSLSSWTNASTPCNAEKPWVGVICFHGIVTGLRLGSMGLSGTISVDGLSNLRGLRTISFVNNSLSGSIPDFHKLQALKAIYLSRNQFTGPIPDDYFSRLAHLKKMWLSGNSFSGNIPSSISKLSLLMELHLESNKFTGEIPDVKLPALKSFDVSNNRLEGPIPKRFAAFGAGSFKGNSDLCGPPLGENKTCESPPSEPEKTATTVASADTAAPPPTATTKEIKSGKAAVVSMVLVTLMLALVAVAVIVKRKKETGFDTLGVENDDVEGMDVQHLPSESSHGKRGGSNHSRRQGGSNHSKRQESSKKGSMAELVIVNGDRGVFGLPDLMKAAAEVLGNGGLGSAYKAVMENGVAVVVKRMREMNRLTKEVFDMEMRKLGRLRHPNVLTPLGYHYRKEEKLMVFDYVEKGSLLFLLHGDRGPYHAALDWPTRLKIVRGIARGMAYLHDELGGAEVPHGNLKSGNVLLGKDFEPLVVDYGYTPLVNPSQAAQAMFAYKSPEFVHYRHVTAKSDVYCLGVVILEVLTGKFPSQYLNSGKGGTDVVQWVISAIMERKEAELLDPEIAGSESSSLAGMERLLRFGAELVEPNPERRLDMKEAARRIEEIAAEPGMPEGSVTVTVAPSLKDGCAELPETSHPELTTRRSIPNNANARELSARRGDDSFEFAIS